MSGGFFDMLIELKWQNVYNRQRIFLTGEEIMAEKIILTGDRPTGTLRFNEPT